VILIDACEAGYEEVCDDFGVVDYTWPVILSVGGVILFIVLSIWFLRRVTKEGDTPKYF